MNSGDYWARTKNVPSTLSPHPDLAPLAASGAGLCDLGCGRGGLLKSLPGAGPRFGVDLNEAALAAATVDIPGARFVCARLAHLPFSDASFDAVCMQAVLTTLVSPGDRREALREAGRVAGRLFISDFLLTAEDPYYNERYERGLAETGERGSFVVREEGRALYTAHHYAPDELVSLLEECGFAVDSFLTGKVRTRSGNVINGARIAARTK